MSCARHYDPLGLAWYRPGDSDYILDFDHAVHYYLGLSDAQSRAVDQANAEYLLDNNPFRGGFGFAGRETANGYEGIAGGGYNVDEGGNYFGFLAAPLTPHRFPLSVHGGVELSGSQDCPAKSKGIGIFNFQSGYDNVGAFVNTDGDTGFYFAYGKGAFAGFGVDVSMSRLFNMLSHPISYLNGSLKQK